MLIDDFIPRNTKEKLTPKWEFITDQVMGGVSTGKMEMGRWENHNCLRLTGNISLENNGGFIQARLILKKKNKLFNAENYRGIHILAKGNGQSYALHLRTQHTWLPWQFYQADFKTNRHWQEIFIPFSKFKPYSLKKSLDIRKIKSVAIVAIKKEFQADILIDRISFYSQDKAMHKKLSPQEETVIIHKGTEPPFSGKYNLHFEKGTYTCKRCGAALFGASAKFKSNCGWPSFDDHIEAAVKKIPDADGQRTEIVCKNCDAHLGHVFTGEGFTPKNTRYCVNSISLDFISTQPPKTQRALFASGCFWGTQYHFQRARGVISTTVGYTGGTVAKPTYKQVCTGATGHAEAVEVIFDPTQTNYEDLARLYFETHDFTQLNRQGPDIGTQYRSAIFYLDERQKSIASTLADILRNKGYDVKTEITPAQKFWPAEEYHQDYYNKNGSTPYCHTYRPLFDRGK